LGFKVQPFSHFSLQIMPFLYSKIGEEQTSDDAEDGPPELLVRMK
jgi:hypothetical protein